MTKLEWPRLENNFYTHSLSNALITFVLLMTNQLTYYSMSLFGKNNGPSDVDGIPHFSG